MTIFSCITVGNLCVDNLSIGNLGKKCFTLFFLLCLSIWANLLFAADIDTRIRQLAGKERVVQLYDPTGRLRYDQSTLQRFVPASTLKIVTGLLALERLGSDYRFTTDLHVNAENDLLVRGGGDPLLVSEEIDRMAQLLIARGIDSVQKLVLDDSRIAWLQVPGNKGSDNPYDAANGGLIVNFNTVNIEKKQDGTMRSAEPQTPLTQVAIEAGQTLTAGIHRMNLGNDRARSLRYSSELIQEVFQRSGVDLSNDALHINYEMSGWTKVVGFKNSTDLSGIVQLMLKYSNNFIANQIGLALPASLVESAPWSLQRSVRFARATLAQRYALQKIDIYFDEFSGLSRNNYITPRAMHVVLEKFKDYAHLLDSKQGALVKSGTLQGIYNYAGYLHIRNKLWPLVIVSYSPTNTRDQILTLLTEIGHQLDENTNK